MIEYLFSSSPKCHGRETKKRDKKKGRKETRSSCLGFNTLNNFFAFREFFFCLLFFYSREKVSLVTFRSSVLLLSFERAIERKLSSLSS